MSKKHLVRILSLVLAVIMLITLVPADTLSFGAAGGVVSEAGETAPAEEALPVVETLPTEEFEAESTAADSEPFNVVRDGVLTADSDGAAGPVDPGVSAGAAAEISAPETQAPAEQASAAETASMTSP